MLGSVAVAESESSTHTFRPAPSAVSRVADGCSTGVVNVIVFFDSLPSLSVETIVSVCVPAARVSEENVVPDSTFSPSKVADVLATPTPASVASKSRVNSPRCSEPSAIEEVITGAVLSTMTVVSTSEVSLIESAAKVAILVVEPEPTSVPFTLCSPSATLVVSHW